MKNVYEGFVVFRAVIMKSSIFWDTTLCVHAGFLLDLFFDPENGDLFLRNNG
jgi:hypothetical protein